MGEAIQPPNMTEPVPVPCIFVGRVAIEVHGEIIRLCGTIDLETVEEGSPPERRIAARVAMPAAVARALVRDLRHVLGRGN